MNPAGGEPASPLPDFSILIPAAGDGERLGLGPKAFLELAGRPLVAWVAGKALSVAADVVVALRPEDLARGAVACPGCRTIEGGGTRQESVARLLAAARSPWVLLQDAARPFATRALMRRVAEAARECGAAGAFQAPEVPVARIEGGWVAAHLQAGEAGIFQAPQAFARDLLAAVLAEAAARGWREQSTLQLVLRAGRPVRAVPGEKTNLKLTTAEDLKLAVALQEFLP